MAVTKSDGDKPRERGAAIQHAGEQGLLFGEDLPEREENTGYRGPTACAAAGITYRQLDYWARTGLVEPSVRAAHGSGSLRLYSFRDILVLKVVKRLLDTGISLQQIRTAVSHLHDRGVSDLARLTLMSDGVSVYECTSPDQVVDLLAGGPHRFEGQPRPSVLAVGCLTARAAPGRLRRALHRFHQGPFVEARPPRQDLEIGVTDDGVADPPKGRQDGIDDPLASLGGRRVDARGVVVDQVVEDRRRPLRGRPPDLGDDRQDLAHRQCLGEQGGGLPSGRCQTTPPDRQSSGTASTACA